MPVSGPVQGRMSYSPSEAPTGPPADPVRWSAAIERALYGPDGFYLAGPGAAGHFRTSVSAAASLREIFAGAIGGLVERVDLGLGRPDPLDLVDLGAGSAELLEAVLGALGSGLRARVRPTVVELRARPADLSPRVRWRENVPEMSGLLIANEWLDNVPLDIVADGRVLLVDHDGAESPGPPPTAVESEWLDRWWPSGPRREIGLLRDLAWAQAVSRVRHGLAVAVDYAHTAADRPSLGTLSGFRHGRETEPIPDGSCDLTAHVAIDAVLKAGETSVGAAGRSVRALLTVQRTALRLLGVDGRRPDYTADPSGYATTLQRASDAAALIDPAGLGGFSWLMQGIGLDPAALLPGLSPPPRP